MNHKIIRIQQSYDSGTLRDGVVVVMEKDGKIEEYSVSGTEWTARCSEQNYEVHGTRLTEGQIQEINHLLNWNAN